jgi:hypothetical protein
MIIAKCLWDIYFRDVDADGVSVNIKIRIRDVRCEGMAWDPEAGA